MALSQTAIYQSYDTRFYVESSQRRYDLRYPVESPQLKTLDQQFEQQTEIRVENSLKRSILSDEEKNVCIDAAKKTKADVVVDTSNSYFDPVPFPFQNRMSVPRSQTLRGFKCSASDGEWIVYYACAKTKDGFKRTGNPLVALDQNGHPVWFFSSSNGFGKKLDTAAEIPLTVNYKGRKIEVQNAELALFLYQIIFTGDGLTKDGDIAWFKAITQGTMTSDESYALKQSLAYIKIDAAKKAFNINSDLPLSDVINTINSTLISWGSQMRVLSDLNEIVNAECSAEFESITSFTIKKKKLVECLRFYSIASMWTWSPKRGALSYLKSDIDKWELIKSNVMFLVLLQRASPDWLKQIHSDFPDNSRFCHYAPNDLFFGMAIDDAMVMKGRDYQGKHLSTIFGLSVSEIAEKVRSIEKILEIE